MKWLLDLNVVLDVLQHRQPFYQASARILSKIVQGDAVGVLPGHALTTIHYIVTRYASSSQADEVIDWLLANLEVVPQSTALFVRARGLSFTDFEDAVVASSAETAACDCIVTRNVADFNGSPIRVTTPEELLASLEE